MNWHILHIVIGLVAFILFVILQAVFINGLKLSFEKGDVLEWWPSLVKRVIANEYLRKPFYSCVKCMASLYGAATFWPCVIYLFGYKPVEIPVFIADVVILSWLNIFIYKRA